MQSPTKTASANHAGRPKPDWYDAFFDELGTETHAAFAGAVARVSLFGGEADDLDRMIADDPFVQFALGHGLFPEAMARCAEAVAARVAKASRSEWSPLRRRLLPTVRPGAVVGAIFDREMTDRLQELAGAVCQFCQQAIGLGLPAIELLPDQILSDYFKGVGPGGRSASERLAERATRADPCRPMRERLFWSWATWIDPQPSGGLGIAKLLGQVVVRDLIMPRIAATESRMVPAIPAPCVRALVDAGGARTAVIRAATPHAESGAEITVGDSQLFLPGDFVEAMTAAGNRGDQVPNPLAVLGTVDAQRVAAWIATQACHRWALGEDDWRRISVAGGWQGLARSVGGTVDSRKKLERCLAALQTVRLRLPDGTLIAGLASYAWRPAAPNRPPEIAIVVGDMLAPGLKGRRRDGAALKLPAAFSRLVPVLDPLPAVKCLSSRSRGRGLLLHWLVMTEFTIQRDKLFEDGAIRLTPRGFETMGRRVGLTARQVVDLVAAWSAPEAADAGSGFLRMVGPGRWTLAPNHAKALSFLVEGGRRTLAARRGARKANERKRRSRSRGRR